MNERWEYRVVTSRGEIDNLSVVGCKEHSLILLRAFLMLGLYARPTLTADPCTHCTIKNL